MSCFDSFDVSYPDRSREPGVIPAMARKKRTAKKYFPKDVYFGSIPAILAELKAVTGRVGATELEMQDQRGSSITQESVINALILWAAEVASGPRGAAELERLLREPMARVAELTAEYRRKHPELWEDVGGEQHPEGFTLPKKGPGKKPGRRGNGRPAE